MLSTWSWHFSRLLFLPRDLGPPANCWISYSTILANFRNIYVQSLSYPNSHAKFEIFIFFTRTKLQRAGPPIATWTGRASTAVKTRGTLRRRNLLARRESSRGGTSRGAWREARSASWGTPGDWLECTTCKALMSHFLLKWALSHPEPAHASPPMRWFLVLVLVL